MGVQNLCQGYMVINPEEVGGDSYLKPTPGYLNARSLFGYFDKTQHFKLLGSRPGLTAKIKKTYNSIILVSLKGLQEA